MLAAAVTLFPAWVAGPATAQDPGACSCLWQGPFSRVHAKADTVLAGRVVQRKGNSIDLEIVEVLRDDPWRDRVRVWLKARDYCRPEPDRFPLGSEWLMALERIDDVPEGGFDPETPNISFGRPGDFLLSACGGYWLERTGDVVSGNLEPSAPRWEYSPEMTPVRLELLRAYLGGEIGESDLTEAAREDPALRELMLDTKSFLRGYDAD